MSRSERAASVRVAGSTVDKDVQLVQIRTRAVLGLPNNYQCVKVELTSKRAVLLSQLFTAQNGTVAAAFVARLPHPGDNKVQLRVSETWASKHATAST